jgi:5S rRNA maturation endonuclease (ribonuclease M5)
VNTLKTGYENSDGIATIRGILVPADWDERGNIIATSVMTYFEEDYLIEQNPRGEELLPYIRQKIKVRGVVRCQENGKKVVTVEDFEILED